MTEQPAARSDYKLAGCVVLLGAILHGHKPNHELLPRLLIQLEGARTLDRIAAMAPSPTKYTHLEIQLNFAFSFNNENKNTHQ